MRMTEVAAAFGSALSEQQADSESCSQSVAAIKVLDAVLRRSEANTVMELVKELGEASEQLVAHAKVNLGPEGLIPVQAACKRYERYIRTSLKEDLGERDFRLVKAVLLKRAEKFTEYLLSSRERLSSFGAKFIGEGKTVLVHGYSRAVMSILARASAAGRNFEVIATESRPDCAGYSLVERCAKLGIPVSLIMDSAIGYIIERVDLVLVGAVGIMESGGVANRVGTFPLALVAKEYKRPFYVAAESFKFLRSYPLGQAEIGALDQRAPGIVQASSRSVLVEDRLGEITKGKLSKPDNSTVSIVNPMCDYTPPDYITLIITDLGVLTPASVSDELITQ